MQRVYSIVVVLFVLINLTFAQSSRGPAQVKWGEELREPAGTSIVKIVDSGPYGFYALRKKEAGPVSKEQVYVEYYDAKNKLRRSQKLDLRYKGKDREFEDLVLIGGELYLLTSFNNEAKKTNYLFKQKIFKKGLRLARDFDKVSEVPSRDKYRDGLFDLVVSSDSSKVLIYSQLPYRKNEPERFSFQVFDNQFSELWSKNIVLPYSDMQFSVEEYRIDKQGNVYLLGVNYQDRTRTRRRGSPNYRYTILAYSQDGEEVQEYKIDLKDKFITDLTFRIGNDGNLVCSGFYSERGTFSIKGTYFFRLNAQTRKVYNKSVRPFDFEFLTEYMRPAERRRAEKAEVEGNENRAPELYDFSLDRLILRSDGGAVLIAEQFFVFEQRYWDYFYGTSRFDVFYNYNDIVVVNIRPDGEIEWSARIPKRQETINDGGYYSSYAMSVVRDKIFFIYNDNGRNFDPNNRQRRINSFNGRNSVVALTEISKDGSVQTYPLFSNREADVLTRPKICKQTGRRKMMVYGERGRTYRFANLEFTN